MVSSPTLSARAAGQRITSANCAAPPTQLGFTALALRVTAPEVPRRIGLAPRQLHAMLPAWASPRIRRGDLTGAIDPPATAIRADSIGVAFHAAVCNRPRNCVDMLALGNDALRMAAFQTRFTASCARHGFKPIDMAFSTNRRRFGFHDRAPLFCCRPITPARPALSTTRAVWWCRGSRYSNYLAGLGVESRYPYRFRLESRSASPRLSEDHVVKSRSRRRQLPFLDGSVIGIETCRSWRRIRQTTAVLLVRPGRGAAATARCVAQNADQGRLR